MIYPLLLIAIPFLILNRRIVRWYPPLLGIIAILLLISFWTLMVSSDGSHSIVSVSKVISSLENFLQPAAIIVLILGFMKRLSYDALSRVFKGVCRMVVVLLSLNSIIVLLSLFFNLNAFLTPFVRSCFEGPSVWELAMSMGRYSGIFNQPLEAGLTYSLGLLSWAYLNRHHRKTNFLDYSLLILLFLGGLMTVSKIFILVGTLIFLVYWNPFFVLKKHLNRHFMFVGALGLCLAVWVKNSWNGYSYFFRLFQIKADTNLIELYTGGRLGAVYSTIPEKFSKVWIEEPLWGYGYGVVSCFDNGFLEFFVQGGLLALLGYIVLLAIFLRYAWRGFLRGYDEGRLLLAYFFLVLAGNFGGPVITINRFSTIFWVSATVLFLLIQSRQKEAARSAFVSGDDRMSASAQEQTHA